MYWKWSKEPRKEQKKEKIYNKFMMKNKNLNNNRMLKLKSYKRLKI